LAIIKIEEKQAKTDYFYKKIKIQSIINQERRYFIKNPAFSIFVYKQKL
jgi:hypothetical protein